VIRIGDTDHSGNFITFIHPMQRLSIAKKRKPKGRDPARSLSIQQQQQQTILDFYQLVTSVLLKGP